MRASPSVVVAGAHARLLSFASTRLERDAAEGEGQPNDGLHGRVEIEVLRNEEGAHGRGDQHEGEVEELGGEEEAEGGARGGHEDRDEEVGVGPEHAGDEEAAPGAQDQAGEADRQLLGEHRHQASEEPGGHAHDHLLLRALEEEMLAAQVERESETESRQRQPVEAPAKDQEQASDAHEDGVARLKIRQRTVDDLVELPEEFVHGRSVSDHARFDTLRTMTQDAHFPDAPAPDLEKPSVGRETYCTWLGRRPYGPVFDLQEQIRRDLKEGRGPERFLLLEHDPVFTIGRNADESDVLADGSWLEREGVEVWESNRGGQVTYHGPGQLVGYPIVSLNPDRRDIGRYVRDLQEVLIRTLADYGIEARRREGKEFIGVWVGEEKIASLGVHLSRWITLHGFALNVATKLEHFGGIVACGLEDVKMTSMERHVDHPPSLEELAARAASHFGDVFERQVIRTDAQALSGRASCI